MKIKLFVKKQPGGVLSPMSDIDAEALNGFKTMARLMRLILSAAATPLFIARRSHSLTSALSIGRVSRSLGQRVKAI